MGDLGHKVLHYVDTWKAGVAVLLLAVLGLGLWNLSLWADLRHTTGHLEQLVQEKANERRDADIAQIRNCVSQATQGPAVQRLLAGLVRILDDGPAKEAALNFAHVNMQSTPRLRDCRELARKLGVTSVPIPQRVS